MINKRIGLLSFFSLFILLTGLIVSYRSVTNQSFDIRSAAKKPPKPTPPISLCECTGPGNCKKITTEDRCRSSRRCSWKCIVPEPTIEPTITEPTITVPNGSEVWEQGNTYQITWEQTQVANSTGLFFYTRDTATGEDNYIGAIEYYVSNVLGTNSYSWTIPTSGPGCCWTTGDNIILSVGQFDSNGQLIIEDKSDSTFTILAPQPLTPTLTSPNGGEVWEQGNTYQITWEQTQVASSTGLFFYTRDANTNEDNYIGAIEYYVSNVLGTNSYSWTIPTSGPGCCWTTGDNIILSVGQFDSNGQLIIEDKSDSTFTISGQTPPTG